MTRVDLVIRNGRIIDPASGKDFQGDIAIDKAKLHSLGEKLDVQGDEEFDASGCIVTPGLIDIHVHCYQYATPLGVNPDECCLSRGVTTVVDAGSSGACTFPGLRKFIAEQSRTRVLCFLHLANHGLAAAGCSQGVPGGESESLHNLDVQQCVDTIKANRDMIIGVKIRLSETITNKGKNEQEAFRRSLEAAEQSGVPLMVHHTLSTVPKQGSVNDGILCCPRDLRPGDILTHTYMAYKSCIVDPETRQIVDDAIDARNRGVLFDVGHGQGSFSWTVAEICVKQGFWPNFISTDLHIESADGPAYDLPTVMSKFLNLGMPLPEVIHCVTSAPAKAIGRSDEFGSLAIGNEADVTILKIKDEAVEVEDCQSQMRPVKQLIHPIAVWRKGIAFPITKPKMFPNLTTIRKYVKDWPILVVKDENPPIV